MSDVLNRTARAVIRNLLEQVYKISPISFSFLSSNSKLRNISESCLMSMSRPRGFSASPTVEGCKSTTKCTMKALTIQKSFGVKYVSSSTGNLQYPKVKTNQLTIKY